MRPCVGSRFPAGKTGTTAEHVRRKPVQCTIAFVTAGPGNGSFPESVRMVGLMFIWGFVKSPAAGPEDARGLAGVYREWDGEKV